MNTQVATQAVEKYRGICELEEYRNTRFCQFWRGEHLHEVFRDVPEYYTEANFFASLGLCPWWMRRFTDSIHIESGKTVLDIATGTHEVAIQVLQKNPGIHMKAMDRSSEMVDFGQRRATELGLTIDADIGDIHHLPFADNSVDVVTLSFASRHLNVATVFKEVYRVLKPGGVFYHNDMLRPEWSIIKAGYLAFLRMWVPVTAIVFHSSKGSRDCSSYFVDSIRNMYSPSELSLLMESVGFHDVHSSTFLKGALAYHSGVK